MNEIELNEWNQRIRIFRWILTLLYDWINEWMKEKKIATWILYINKHFKFECNLLNILTK